MTQKLIISRLLDKYEKSNHLYNPGASNRRVMLRVDKKELPEYDYENASTRDAFNAAAKNLQQQGFVSIEWLTGRPVLASVILNLDQVMRCYNLINRTHPRDQATTVAEIVMRELSHISTDWIIAWRNDVLSEAQDTFKVPFYCKKDSLFFSNLITAFVVYDSLRGAPITMRAFSSKCYHNSKYFEHEIRDQFLRIALKYNAGLSEIHEQENLGVRDQLAYLGIYARPELYELSGNCTINTSTGSIDLATVSPYGLGLPSTIIDSITTFDLSRIHSLIFIENKTNYDEYILSDLQQGELAIYHGGFLSPQKRKLFSKIAESIQANTNVYFWADIDLGGFQMFSRLQQIIPKVIPMRMSSDDIVKYQKTGLKRNESYLDRLEVALARNEFPLFRDSIEKILEYGITIEQEVFLAQ